MDKEKVLIKHEIFNLLTAINMIAASSKLSKRDKMEIQKLVKVTGLLISYEQVILGGKVRLFKEEFDLHDVLDLVLIIHEEDLKKCKVIQSFSLDPFPIKADKTAVKDFLEQCLVHLSHSADSIEFFTDPLKKILTIRYSGSGRLQLAKKSLLDCLKDKACIKDELPLRLAMHLIQESGQKVTFGEKEIQVRF